MRNITSLARGADAVRSRRAEDATGADARLLRRAWLTVAAQTAVAVMVLLFAMAGAVLLVNDRQQHAEAQRLTHDLWESSGDMSARPAVGWLVAEAEGKRSVTAEAPHGLDGISPHALPDGETVTLWRGRQVAIFTGVRFGVGRVSAVYDMSEIEAQEARLLKSMAVGIVLGVAGATVLGALIGRRAVRPLGEALAVQRRFVADASHELRTPLTVLLTRAQMLRRRLEADHDPRTAEQVDRLVADARVLGGVVDDLLVSAETSHHARGGERVDVTALVRDVEASMRDLAAERGVHLRTTVTPQSGADGDADREIVVAGAEAALRRAVTALTDNALAHTPAGGHVVLSVTREGKAGGAGRDHRAGGQVLVCVRDDGEGLDPRTASRLVERFARGTSEDAGRRFGLGLSLVDEIARAHGGSLQIDGAVGAGASFTLRLPPADDAPQPGAPRASRRPGHTVAL